MQRGCSTCARLQRPIQPHLCGEILRLAASGRGYSLKVGGGGLHCLPQLVCRASAPRRRDGHLTFAVHVVGRQR